MLNTDKDFLKVVKALPKTHRRISAVQRIDVQTRRTTKKQTLA
jgi:hypothetical protein